MTEVDLFIAEMTELAEQRRAAEVAQTFWIVFFWVYFACIALSACVASQKQALFRGVVYGLFLGPLGVIAAGLLDGRAHCPQCGERVYGKLRWDKDHGAVWDHYPVCPYCGHTF